MRTRSKALTPTLLGIGGVLAVVVAWHLVATFVFTRPNGSYGAVPPPLAAFARVGADLVDPAYWNGIAATAGAALTGYLLAIGVALVLGVLVLLAPRLESFANQLGVVAACIPVAAISPIVVLLSPTGSRAVSVVLALLAVEFPMIIGVLLGLRATSPGQLDLVHAYGGGTITAIRKVRLIAAIPALLSALKIGAPAAFLGAMTGEFFAVGVDSGAGRLLISQQYAGDYVGMWAIAILASVVSALGYGVIAVVARWLAPWTTHSTGGAR
ncbi:ABC transporter permease [Herbiconiux liangxiaofengii]|uniref:ABC transporter permease n=1 Tax=Herbiconiux liangxiaofengii TaxID=3342795 RepID=UPI0035B8D630